MYRYSVLVLKPCETYNVSEWKENQLHAEGIFPTSTMRMSCYTQAEARRKKYIKHKKAHQLAMRFSAPEKVRKRSLLRQAPGREVILRGLVGLVVKPKFPGSTPIFDTQTVSYGPASRLGSPTHPPILTALDGRAQHELRTPAMQSVSSSKPLNLEYALQGGWTLGRRLHFCMAIKPRSALIGHIPWGLMLEYLIGS